MQYYIINNPRRKLHTRVHKVLRIILSVYYLNVIKLKRQILRLRVHKIKPFKFGVQTNITHSKNQLQTFNLFKFFLHTLMKDK